MVTERRRASNRERIRRYRARHKIDDAIKAEQRGRMRAHGARPTYRVIEVVSPDGIPVDVRVVKADAAVTLEPGCALSDAWIPSLVVSEALARRIATFRLGQIQAWCSGPPGAPGGAL
jgi:hypothetical protein